MFGKTGVFCNGLMFGMVTDTLFVQVDDHNRAVFKEAKSVAPLNYVKKGQTIDLSFGVSPRDCSTNRPSLSDGLVPRWGRHGGSRPNGTEQRQTSSPQSQQAPWENLIDPLSGAGS